MKLPGAGLFDASAQSFGAAVLSQPHTAIGSITPSAQVSGFATEAVASTLTVQWSNPTIRPTTAPGSRVTPTFTPTAPAGMAAPMSATGPRSTGWLFTNVTNRGFRGTRRPARGQAIVDVEDERIAVNTSAASVGDCV